MKKLALSIAAMLSGAVLVPSAAMAAEIFGGVYVHGVDTPLTLGGSPEGGVDAQLGFRGGPIFAGTKLEPYVFGALNSKGTTHYAAAGLAWKFGDRIYVRPGLGWATGVGAEPAPPVFRAGDFSCGSGVSTSGDYRSPTPEPPGPPRHEYRDLPRTPPPHARNTPRG